MSDKDKTPNVPDADGDKTILRPRPSPLKPDAASTPPSDRPAPSTPPVDYTVFRPNRTAADVTTPSVTASAPATTSPEPRDDFTVVRPNPGGRRPRVTMRAEETSADTTPLRQSVTQVTALRIPPGANPILSAAAPLLLLLGHLRTSLSEAQSTTLPVQISDAIQTFETELQAGGISAAQANAAKYILCATADRVLANLPSSPRGADKEASLLSRFFGASANGPNIFQEIERLKSERSFYPVVELAHACLALGFQGSQRFSTTTEALERDVQHDLYDLIEKAKAQQPRSLSPHWQGQQIPSQVMHLHVPFWAVAGAVALSLFVVFVVLKTRLGQSANQAAQTMISLNPPKPVMIARRNAVPAPAPVPESTVQMSRLDHIRSILQPNISAGLVSLETNPNQIIIRLPESSLFQPGKISLLDDGRALLRTVVFALNTESGAVKIIGNTDDTPVSNARFASNFEVSEAYAKAVAAVVKQSLAQPERLEAEGKGNDAPIAGNDTPQGRAKNRRIDVVIARSD